MQQHLAIPREGVVDAAHRGDVIAAGVHGLLDQRLAGILALQIRPHRGPRGNVGGQDVPQTLGGKWSNGEVNQKIPRGGPSLATSRMNL